MIVLSQKIMVVGVGLMEVVVVLVVVMEEVVEVVEKVVEEVVSVLGPIRLPQRRLHLLL
jgi:hypothetical protein